jgi:hypothetical protein
MIKVNTQTNTASREAVPKALKGLSPETLINLQTALNPVPPEFIDIEFWPENLLPQTLLDTEKFGAEILKPQVKDKVVDVSYVIETKSDEEIQSELSAAMESIRSERNRLLAATDYFALSDVTMSDEMTAYRQALRDLPASVDINNIIYPDKP